MSSTTRHSKWLLLLVPIVPAVVIGWMVCSGVLESVRAEENLHATLFVLRLVEEFVDQNQRWPASWAELEQLSVSDDAPRPKNGKLSVVRIGGQHGYAWPQQSKHLRECVEIDFDPDIDAIVNEDPMEFDAIKPIGPYYEYRDYGFVESLQSTLREATTSSPTPPEAN